MPRDRQHDSRSRSRSPRRRPEHTVDERRPSPSHLDKSQAAHPRHPRSRSRSPERSPERKRQRRHASRSSSRSRSKSRERNPKRRSRSRSRSRERTRREKRRRDVSSSSDSEEGHSHRRKDKHKDRDGKRSKSKERRKEKKREKKERKEKVRIITSFNIPGKQRNTTPQKKRAAGTVPHWGKYGIISEIEFVRASFHGPVRSCHYPTVSLQRTQNFTHG